MNIEFNDGTTEPINLKDGLIAFSILLFFTAAYILA
jgi:hypothetical protein